MSDKEQKKKVTKKRGLLPGDKIVLRMKRSAFERKSLSKSLKRLFHDSPHWMHRRLIQHHSRARFTMEYDIPRPRKVEVNGRFVEYTGP